MKISKILILSFFLGFSLKNLSAMEQSPIDQTQQENNQNFIKAIEEDNLDLAIYYLDQGADINAKNQLIGTTALIHVTKRGKSSQEIKFFLEKGANINAQDLYGMSALMYASKKGNLLVVQTLLENDASVNLVDKKYRTALIFAIQGNHTSIASLLIYNNSFIHLRDHKGRTALFYAAQSGSNEILQILIANNANIDMWDNLQRTPLMEAVICGHMETIKLLLQNDANTELVDINGKTVHDLVEDFYPRMLKKTEIINLLKTKN